MGKVAILILILANIGLQSDAKVELTNKEDNYDPSYSTIIRCIVTNETFLGWFKDDQKIQQYAKKEDIKGSVGVLAESGGTPFQMHYVLIFPANLQSTVGGNYDCKGQTNKASLLVVMRYNIASLQTKQQLHIGEKGKIVVGALSFPLSTFKWKKDGKAVDFSASGGRLTLEKDGSITFSNVLKNDNGTYVVNIDWQKRNQIDKTITVSVVEKPKFISTPKPAKFIGVTGYDYEFCFNVTGIPKPTLQWFKSTVQFDTTNVRYSIKGNCITIAKLEKMDVAPYKCTAKNTAGEASATIEIERLGVNPTLEAFPQNLYKANVGSNFELKCTGKGDPLPTLEWSKDGKVIASSKNKSVLKITAVKNEDSGNYTCTVKNGLIHKGKELTETKTITFLAITKPAINDVKSDSKVYSYVKNPNKVTLQCYFFGVPTPSVILTRNGENITTGKEFVEFSIETKSIKEFGDYNCTGKNMHGSYTHTVKVLQATVPGKPASVTADKTCNSITLIWKQPQSNGHMPILDYLISYNKTTRHNVPDGNSRFRLPYEFKPKTAYNFSISARNIVGHGAAETIKVTTEEYCKPSPPSIWNLKRKQTSVTMVVKWNAPEFDGFDSELTYKISWRPRENPEAAWNMSEELNKTTLMYTIPDELMVGKTYEVNVKATNKAGESRPGARIVQIVKEEEPPVAEKRTGGLSKGVIAGIVIAILLIVLITIDLFCCFFNSCGVIFCCQRACCAKTYEVDGKGKGNEMEKLNKNPPPENV